MMATLAHAETSASTNSWSEWAAKIPEAERGETLRTLGRLVPDLTQRTQAAVALVSIWSPKDWPSAAESLATAARQPNGRLVEAEGVLFQRWSEGDAEGWWRYLTEKLPRATGPEAVMVSAWFQRFLEEEWRRDRAAVAARVTGISDGRVAIAAIETLLTFAASPDDLSRLREWANRVSGQPDAVALMRNLAEQSFALDPAETMRWVRAMPAGPARHLALLTVFYTMGAQYAQLGVMWFNSAPDRHDLRPVGGGDWGEAAWRQDVTTAFVRGLLAQERNPERRLGIIRQVTDAPYRSLLVDEFIRQTRAIDPLLAKHDEALLVSPIK